MIHVCEGEKISLCIGLYILYLIYPVLCYHKPGYIAHLCTSLHGDLCDFSEIIKKEQALLLLGHRVSASLTSLSTSRLSPKWPHQFWAGPLLSIITDTRALDTLYMLCFTLAPSHWRSIYL